MAVTDHTRVVSPHGDRSRSDRYKWTALFVSTLGMLMATIDGSIVLIAMPDIFRGIGINPLQPGNTFYLLWMILGFLVVTSVLVVTLGRLGDIYGRVRIYNLGFAVFTFFSLLLTITWMSGHAAGIWLIVMRIFQAVGAAMLMANSAAILTDAFPSGQRGLALGINQAAAFSGSFIGLILGGVLGPIDWRLIFLVSVPVGLLGTVMGYVKLRELGERRPAAIDWPGNITFGLGLVLIMVGITYGIEPYGHSAMGWGNPLVLTALGVGVMFTVAFCIIETKVAEPMFRLQLFKIRAFTSGVFASFLAALSRGGLMFMLVIWLQGIWLPLHGYDFARTPLWAGIAMIPLTVGLLISGPAHRHPVGPVRRSPLRHGRNDRSWHLLRPAGAAPHQLFLLGVRAPSVSHWGDDGGVRLSEPYRCHEQPSRRTPGRRLGNEHHLPELGAGLLHRDLLHPDDRRLVVDTASQPLPGSRPTRGAVRDGEPSGTPTARLHALCCIFGVQPDRAPHRREHTDPSSCGPTISAPRSRLLPEAHHRAVPRRPARRARLRHRRQLACGGGFVDPWRAVRTHGVVGRQWAATH